MVNRFAVPVALCLGLAATACSDSQAPTGSLEIDFAKGGKAKVFDDYSGSSTAATETGDTTVATTCGGDGTGPSVLRQRADAPRLVEYQTSFTVIQGDKAEYTTYYEDGTKFMWFYIPHRAQLINEYGEPAARGEAVEVTVSIDPESFSISFGPHGSTFVQNFPAELYFSLAYADLGGCDPNNASVWYQPTTSDPWSDQASQWDYYNGWISTELYHFSNYAVAW